MLGETKNQFSFTRAALSTSGRAKGNFSSVNLLSVLLALFGAAFFLRSFLAAFPGFTPDLETNLRTVDYAAVRGVTLIADLAEAGHESYPPLFVYVAAPYMRLMVPRFTALAERDPNAAAVWKRIYFRILPILADLAIGLVLFLVLQKYCQPPIPLLGVSAFLFNPCAFLNSALWQFDAVHCLFILLIVVCLGFASESGKGGDLWVLASTVLFALAISTKLQSIVIGPVLATVILARHRWRLVLGAGIVWCVTMALVYMPFILAKRWDYFEQVFLHSFTVDSMVQLNAFNFWSLGFQRRAAETVLGISYRHIGQVCYLATVVWTCGWLYLSKAMSRSNPERLRAMLVAGAYACLAPFMVLTAMHDRYVAPVIPLLILAGCLDRRLRWPAVGISVACTLNMLYVLGYRNVSPEDVTMLMAGRVSLRMYGALLNIGLFLWMTLKLPMLLAPNCSQSVSAGCETCQPAESAEVFPR